jgi:hypothetical protein
MEAVHMERAMSAVIDEQPYVRPAWLDPWLHKVRTQPPELSKRQAERAQRKAANAIRKAEYHAYIAKRKAEQRRLIELRKAERSACKALIAAQAAERDRQMRRPKMKKLSVVKPVQPPRPKTRPIQEEGFTPDPIIWSDDGGAKRVPIYDHNFGQSRLVRRVGWTNCLGRGARHRIFSYDVTRERICSSCKGSQARGTIDD